MAYKSKTHKRTIKKNVKKHSKKPMKKHTKKVRFSKKTNKVNTPKIKVIKRKKTPYMKGGNQVLDTFFPKNFNLVVPFLPPQNTYYPLSSDIHGINNILESSSNIPVNHNGGGLTDFIPTDITNLGRNVILGARNVYAGFAGEIVPASADPNVTYQPQLEKAPVLDIQPADVSEIYNTSDLKVASI